MTAIWGPLGWLTLHSISVAYPEYPGEADKRILEQYMEAFASSITCPYCQRHFEDMFRTYKQQHPEWKNSKRDLFLAICRMHNSVNRRLDKPIISTVKHCIETLKNATRDSTSSDFRKSYISHIGRNWSSFQNSEGFMKMSNVRLLARINSDYWDLRDIPFSDIEFEEADVLENIHAIGLPQKMGPGFPTMTSGKSLPSIGLKFKGGRLSLGGR